MNRINKFIKDLSLEDKLKLYQRYAYEETLPMPFLMEDFETYTCGYDVSDCIPVDLQGSPMNTKNDYRQWHFEDWVVVWETVHQGLPFDAWLVKNQWVKSLPINSSQYEELYDAISDCDWIHGSCGGCI